MDGVRLRVTCRGAHRSREEPCDFIGIDHSWGWCRGAS
jgi:hypothetical protein